MTTYVVPAPLPADGSLPPDLDANPDGLCSVRDPVTLELLPKEGAFVDENDPFWQRRILDGDVVESAPPDPPC
jgi:Protein of unknown function (DUF2635)